MFSSIGEIVLKMQEEAVARAFYPFVEKDQGDKDPTEQRVSGGLPSLDVAQCETRIAVYDDLSAAPRVVIIDPQETRTYLEEITREVTNLSHEQGGSIPFMVIREVVENLIHAYFIEPTISILDHGNTIRFADQGPGIKEKARALQYGTTSATSEMRQYIRGTGSGLPYAQQYLHDKGGELEIEDNISTGTIVTISLTSPQRVETTIATPLPVTEVPPIAAAAPTRSQIVLSERGQLVVDYLKVHESVGPKELVEAYGKSQATWTRELQALEGMGVVAKRGGQKRFLTDMGRMLLA